MKRLLLLAACLTLVAAHAHAQTIPLYTWFSANRGDHFTTSDPNWAGAPGDVKLHSAGGYVLVRVEGQLFDPARAQPAGTLPLYSFWNPTAEDNFTTSDPSWTAVSARDGYTRSRLEGYLHAEARATGTVPLTSLWSASRRDNYATTDPRLKLPLESRVDEQTMSVEGGRYAVYRIEGHVLPPAGAAPRPRPALTGLVDLHTHPMVHLAFGKKLVHGAPDIGSIIPAGTRDCNRDGRRASSEAEALGHDNSTHGGHGLDNTCGNDIRKAVIQVLESENGAQSVHGADKTGFPAFAQWPKWNDLTHQQMWVEWIRHAHSQGMRVMVALATNNSTLGSLVQGDGPLDDRSSADLQLAEIRSFVGRHGDFMEVALTSAQLRRIVSAGKLAVVMGVELDDLGNFTSLPTEAVTRAAISAEITRLRGLGVRYVFPIHLVNNKFGGAAAYEDLFVTMTRLQYGSWMDLECSATVGFHYNPGAAFEVLNVASMGGIGRPAVPPCPAGKGHRNRLGLTATGQDAVGALMRAGMLIDVDHMSEHAVDDTILAARTLDSGWGYPLLSGHNGARAAGGSERQLRGEQLEQIRDLGGMLGLGWENQTAATFSANLARAQELMGARRVGFGTDTNGLSRHIQPPGDATRVSTTWTAAGERRAWSFRDDGVANWGMIPDLVTDVGQRSPAAAAGLSAAAESFARVWERAELASASVARGIAAAPPSSAKELTFTPAPTDWFCPSAVLAGDREFDGHGPQVWASAEARIRADKAVEVVVTMRAKETVSDWSETRGSWTVTVSPPGVRASAVLSDARSETDVISSGAGFQIIAPGGNANTVSKPPVNGGRLAAEFQIVGDTGGDDISTDNDCNDDTRMRIVFAPMRVRLEP